MSSLCPYHARRRATHTAVVVDVDNSLPGETAYRRIPVCEECAAYLGEHSTSKVEPLGSFQAPRRALLVPETAFCATSDIGHYVSCERPFPVSQEQNHVTQDHTKVLEMRAGGAAPPLLSRQAVDRLGMFAVYLDCPHAGDRHPLRAKFRSVPKQHYVEKAKGFIVCPGSGRAA